MCLFCLKNHRWYYFFFPYNSLIEVVPTHAVVVIFDVYIRILAYKKCIFMWWCVRFYLFLDLTEICGMDWLPMGFCLRPSWPNFHFWNCLKISSFFLQCCVIILKGILDQEHLFQILNFITHGSLLFARFQSAPNAFNLKTLKFHYHFLEFYFHKLGRRNSKTQNVEANYW